MIFEAGEIPPDRDHLSFIPAYRNSNGSPALRGNFSEIIADSNDHNLQGSDDI